MRVQNLRVRDEQFATAGQDLAVSVVRAMAIVAPTQSIPVETASAAVPVSAAATGGPVPATINLGALDPSVGIKLTGSDAQGLFSQSLGAAGDVNGDGINDFLVAAPFADATANNSGAVYLVYGQATGLSSTTLSASTPLSQAVRYTGANALEYLGAHVSGVGDINKDGRADFAIATSGTSGTNTIYVLYGKAGTALTGASLGASVATGDGFTITSAGSDGLGPIAAIGDVNRDGVADYLVSAPGSGTGGAAWVLYGSTTGLHSINLASITATDGYKLTGTVAGGNFGADVAAAGDVNKDGIADFIVGAPGENAAYVLFGGGAPVTNLATLTAAQGFKIVGSAESAGFSVASAGDINGDGFADVIVGTYAGYGGAGHAYVVYGKASGATVTLATMTTAQGFTIAGTGQMEAGKDVSAIGDFNGDGFSDVLVGQYYGSDGKGGAYVIFGKANVAPTGTLDLGAFTSANGVKITGASGYSGHSVVGVGDVNGDGGLDIVISAEQDNGSTGAAYVLFGKTLAPPNAAPSGADKTLATNEDTALVLSATNFGFTDTNGNALLAVKITTLPTAGTLTNNGVAVAVGAFVSKADIDLGRLIFTPAANANGTNYAHFTFQVQDNGGTANGGVDLDPTAHTLTFNVAAVDDLPVAVADIAALLENATTSIAVLANDTDIDGGPKTIATVNGVVLTAGQTTTLASGAIVTLNANGTLGYDPNHKFDYLVSAATAGATGAADATATDTFSYTLNGGSQASVTVTINGVDGTGDQLRGGTGNDTIVGSPTAVNTFDLSQGGTDTVTGGAANDSFYFGATFSGADRVDGGAGTNDQIGLRGDYTGGNRLVLAANTITNVEVLTALPGFSYDITTVDANLAAGQTLSIYGSTLGASDNLTFNGSAETSGRFMVYGGLGHDHIVTGGGNDGIYFGRDGRFDPLVDTVDGGAGSDQVALDGSYTTTITRAAIVNVETLVLLDGSPAPANYNITLADDWTQGSELHTVYAVGVRNGVVVNGGAETDAALRFFGGSGNDTLTGGAAGNTFDGGAGADTMKGGAGVDTFAYTTALNSMGTAHDTIINFNPTQDKIDLPFAVTAIDAAKTGALTTATFDTDLTSALATLGAHHAVQFTATSGDLATHVFEVIDANGVAGYQAGQDMVIELVTPTAPIVDPGVFV